jgi:hypothetical protein
MRHFLRVRGVLQGGSRRPRAASLLATLVVLTVLAGCAATAAAQTPVPSSVAQLAATLGREGTYVSPRLSAEVPLAAEARLQRQLDRASVRGLTLRLAILDQVPTPYRALEDFTDALYSALGLSDSVLVVATPHGIAARSDRLSNVFVEQQAAFGRLVLERDGYVRALETVADGLVSEAVALAPPTAVPAPLPPSAQMPERVIQRRPGDGLLGLLPALFLLAIVAGGYVWLSRRLWRQRLGAMLAAREALTARLGQAQQADPSRGSHALESARRSLDIGGQALDDVRALPWWSTWLLPWSPPLPLRLAERAYGAALQYLDDRAAAEPAVAPPAAVSPDQAGDSPAPPDLGRGPAPAETTAGASAAPSAAAADLGDGLPRPRRLDPPTEQRANGEDHHAAVLPAPRAAAASPPGTTPTSPADAEAEPRTRTRWGWFGRKVDPAEPLPTASLAPERVLAGLQPEQPLACFFCGCPLLPHQAQVGRVALAGSPVRPLLCARHAAALAADERPAVWARAVGEDILVPWFRDPDYSPGWDYDPNVVEPVLAWDVLPPPEQLLAPPLRVVVHADDPRWEAID